MTEFNICASRSTGKERDQESGLDYSGARMYMPMLGRFGSADPSGLGFANLNNPQSFNLYSYAYNQPLLYIDPLGLCGSTDGGGGINGDDTCEEAGQDSGQIGARLIFSSDQYNNGGGGCNNCGWEDNDDPDALNGEDTPHGQQTPSTTGPESWGENGFLTAVDRVVYSRGMKNTVNFSSGYSDTFTFGFTRWANRKLGQGDFIDSNTKSYWAGSISGAAVGAYVYGSAVRALRFVGPAKAYKLYQNGRVFGVMYGTRFLLRVDQHPMAPGGDSLYHAHVWSQGGEHGWRFALPFLNW